MTDRRPDPDQILARIRESEAREHGAKLKIFFGASAGVGKTFAMLIEAHERRRAGTEVVVGVVETHGRAETAALLDGLDVLPLKTIEYRGTSLAEFDLDAAIARKPGLILIDELAHTNAPGSRHAKRWLDVLEILNEGIDVYTTLNVQHVEGLYDLVAQITGVSVRELVPEDVIERANEIELVDLPPDDLLQRLREGKVYLPAQAERAREHFFKKGNLIALRELALRLMADRVDAQMESYRRDHAIRDTWSVGGRMLVCLGDPASGLKLVRAAKHIASRLGAEWIVAHVEKPAEVTVREASRDHLVDVMSYAEELGAETAYLSGTRVADQILAYARERNVSRIIVGRPTRARWLEALMGSVVGTLVRESGDMSVTVMHGEGETEVRPARAPAAPRRSWREYGPGIAAVGAATLISWLLHSRFGAPNLVMVYLLGVMGVAVRSGRGPAILASILSVLAFDFFFVPPPFTLGVSDTEYLLTFGVMLAAALLISTMASRVREQGEAARSRERRTAALFGLSRELAGIPTLPDLLAASARRSEDVFDGSAGIFLPDATGRLARRAGDPIAFSDEPHDRGVAQWSFDHEQPAGLGTQTLPASRALYVPLMGPRGAVGVIGLAPRGEATLGPDAVHLLEGFAHPIALAIERARFADETEQARVQVESERLRNTLLSSVSHDLRTPLAVITGAATSLTDESDVLPAEVRRELAETIAEEAQRLNRLVTNLLDMTRLESGAVQVRKGWHSVEEIIGVALERMGPRLDGRTLSVGLAPDMPLVSLDDVLMGQLLFNLLDNAVKYTPPGSAIDIGARLEARELVIEVADRGPGLPAGEEQQVFEKFHRARREGEPGGVGLGLAICQAIAHAHGGRIVAANRSGGGASFTLSVPTDGAPPPLAPIESPEDGASA